MAQKMQQKKPVLAAFYGAFQHKSNLKKNALSEQKAAANYIHGWLLLIAGRVFQGRRIREQ